MEEQFINHDKQSDEQQRGIRTSSPSMDNLFSNRDVLARRLKCRLDREDLIVRGIMPPQNTSPNIVAQIHQLERAKAEDMLRKKIRVRSSRQQLVQRHILADTTIAASLHEKQSALERHRIADHLNEQLFNRPGPLELIKDNILEVEPKFADAVKHGCVPFHPTCKDVSTSPIDGTIIDSLLSDQDSQAPYMECISPLSTESIDTFTQAFSEHVNVNNVNDLNSSWCNTYLTNDEISNQSLSDSKQLKDNRLIDLPQKSEGTKDLSTKKQLKQGKKKQQIQNKSRVKKYKYHEYKPPGNVPQTYQAPLDDRYKRLLEQQQMFLQLQVMKQNALFAAMNSSEEDTRDSNMSEECNVKEPDNLNSVSTITEPSSSHCQQASELNEMRVIDLRSQLRQRGLPVSGSKARLLERLKSYEDKKAMEKEKQSKADEKSNLTCYPSRSTSLTHTITPDIVPNCTNVVTNSNAFIKVTTYATQNGQTFQVVQAVPNMHQQYQYQLIPQESVLVTSSGHLNQSPITHFQTQKDDLPNSYKSYPIENSLVTLPSNFFPTSNVALIRPENEAVTLQNAKYPQEAPANVVQQLNFELPGRSTAVTSDLINENKQFLNSSLCQSSASDFQTQLHSNRQSDKKSDKRTANGNMRKPVISSHSVLSKTLSHDSVLSSQTNSNSLLDHLQQIQNSITMPGNSDMILNGEPNIDSHSLMAHDGLSSSNRQDNRYNQIRLTKSTTTTDRNFNYRNRSHTDPAGFEKSQMSLDSLHADGTAPIVLQQNGTVVVVTRGVTETKNSTSSIQPISSVKQESQTSEDLLDILGAISESVQPSLNDSVGHSGKACLSTANRHDADFEVKQEPGQFLSPFYKTKHADTESLTIARTYSSLPGDLNRLDSDFHDFYGVSHSTRASCTSLARDTPESNQIFTRTLPTHDGSTPPMTEENGDECISMDVDDDVYLVDNDLDWLNLNPKSVSSDNANDNCHSVQLIKDNDDMSMNICGNSFDLTLTTVHPNEVLSKPGTSILDYENNHPLIMSVDAIDHGKLHF